jgi:hypothetical protein
VHVRDSDSFTHIYGRVFGGERLEAIRPFNDPQYRENYQRWHRSESHPTADHFVEHVVGTQLTEAEIVGLHHAIAADRSTETAPFRHLMQGPVAARFNELQAQANEFVVGSSTASTSRELQRDTPAAGPEQRRHRNPAVASAMKTLRGQLREGEVATLEQIHQIAYSENIESRILQAAARRDGLYGGRRPVVKAAVQSALDQIRQQQADGQPINRTLLDTVATQHNISHTTLVKPATEQGLYVPVNRRSAGRTPDVRPSPTPARGAAPSQAARVKQEPAEHQEDLRFWSAPAHDGDPVFETYRPTSAIVGFEQDDHGALRPVFGERSDADVTMFVRRREQGYNADYNARFPIRDGRDPRAVHPYFASQHDRARCAPGITVESVDITKSGSELLARILPQSSARSVAEARRNVEGAIAGELQALLNGQRPPSEAHARVHTIREDQVPAHEQMLAGQRGLFAERSCPDARTGIIGIFGGAYAQDSRHLEHLYGQDNVDAYSLQLSHRQTDYVVAPYGGGNDMQYANTAIRAPRSSTRPNFSYDTERLNASFMPALVTFRRGDQTLEMPVAAVVGHPGMIRAGQEIRLDYGDAYLERFRQAYDDAHRSAPVPGPSSARSPQPVVKREPSEAPLPPQGAQSPYRQDDAERLAGAYAGHYPPQQSRGQRPPGRGR